MPKTIAAILSSCLVAGLFLGVTPSANAASLRGVKIVKIYYDSPGSDTGSNYSLNAEWVKLKNVTSTRKTITGWKLRDAAGHVYRLPTFRLAAGSTVRIHTGSGSN